MGCQLDVVVQGDNVEQVTGNQCARGVIYAKKEVVNPTRILTSVVFVNHGVEEMVSVKTSTDIPKSMLRQCAASLRGLRVEAPVKSGDIIVENLCGTGANLVATKGVARRED
jgi:CxxC motif-containing protein